MPRRKKVVLIRKKTKVKTSVKVKQSVRVNVGRGAVPASGAPGGSHSTTTVVIPGPPSAAPPQVSGIRDPGADAFLDRNSRLFDAQANAMDRLISNLGNLEAQRRGGMRDAEDWEGVGSTPRYGSRPVSESGGTETPERSARGYAFVTPGPPARDDSEMQTGYEGGVIAREPNPFAGPYDEHPQTWQPRDPPPPPPAAGGGDSTVPGPAMQNAGPVTETTSSNSNSNDNAGGAGGAASVSNQVQGPVYHAPVYPAPVVNVAPPPVDSRLADALQGLNETMRRRDKDAEGGATAAMLEGINRQLQDLKNSKAAVPVEVPKPPPVELEPPLIGEVVPDPPMAVASSMPPAMNRLFESQGYASGSAIPVPIPAGTRIRVAPPPPRSGPPGPPVPTALEAAAAQSGGSTEAFEKRAEGLRSQPSAKPSPGLNDRAPRRIVAPQEALDRASEKTDAAFRNPQSALNSVLDKTDDAMRGAPMTDDEWVRAAGERNQFIGQKEAEELAASMPEANALSGKRNRGSAEERENVKIQTLDYVDPSRYREGVFAPGVEEM